ncbi:hypothetical protein [Cohnella sp. 56]
MRPIACQHGPHYWHDPARRMAAARCLAGFMQQAPARRDRGRYND